VESSSSSSGSHGAAAGLVLVAVVVVVVVVLLLVVALEVRGPQPKCTVRGRKELCINLAHTRLSHTWKHDQ
jgi:predicted metalloprotease